MAALPSLRTLYRKKLLSLLAVHRRHRSVVFRLAAYLGCLAAPFCARAQISAGVTLQSQYLVRGYSVSAGQPTALLNVSYDHPSGFYANGSAIADLDAAHNPAFLGGIANLGYVRPLTSALSVDGGLMRTQYSQTNGVKSSVGYSEAYLGLLAPNVTFRIYYSPDYFKNSSKEFYGEIEGRHQIWAGVTLGAHVGYLNYVANPYGYPRRTDQYDWRITASRPFRKISLFLAVSGGGPGRDYYLNQTRSKTVLMGGASWAF